MLQLLDPEVVRKLIEAEEDVLTPAVKQEEERYKGLRCPLCGEDGCIKQIEPVKTVMLPDGSMALRTPFGGNVLPQGYAHCIHCGTDFSPSSGIIRSTEASIIHGLPEESLPNS